MYDIHMAEVTEDFAHCWQAAGLHLQNQGQGGINSWIRAHLNPPFLEHLSFRLGNQLFFIRLLDASSGTDFPGGENGLFAIANGCNGYACLMPMRRQGETWEPAESGWGLLDARSRKPVNPAALITEEKIEMTDWELHDFAVQIVRDNLEKEGCTVTSWEGNPNVYPSIWFEGKDKTLQWVAVNAVRYPALEADIPQFAMELKKTSRFSSYVGHFASVSVASVHNFESDAHESGTMVPLYRGYGMHVRYGGLEPLKN
jgi:hypothetical protein